MTRMASVTEPNDWTDFETALETAKHLGGGYGVGYVIAADDPFTFIDMDVKDQDNCSDPAKWSSAEALNRYWQIAQTFNSYTERSSSGKGLHVIVLGGIGAGLRRDGVELYSQARFMVCTGDAVIASPIVDGQKWLDVLAKEMESTDSKLELEEHDAKYDDGEIVEKLLSAINGEKFNDLCKGDWSAMGYPSQSEADLALMSMFCFHSPNNEQCMRLFRMTGLGKREKAIKNDVYLKRTLKIVRGRQGREELVQTHGAACAAALLAGMQVSSAGDGATVGEPVSCGLHSAPPPEVEAGIDWPPGWLGILAYHMFQTSPRPVKEISIVAALGLIAGICGRSYQLPQSGLNLYIVLVARSAVGKEAMHSNISKVVGEMMMSVPSIMRHVSYADFASGPALVKGVSENQCFCNISGEFGRKLKRLAMEDGREGPMQQLRTVMTNLYQKSGAESIVGGMGYSDKEKNVASVNGVAYSMIGETTPNTFYESLTESMMDDGFLSRFTIVEYNGDRPELRTDEAPPLHNDLKNLLAQLVTQAGQPIFTKVERDGEAAKLLYDFDKECDRQINSTTDEGWRQMWNRAHLKLLRIAALLAVCDNPSFPVMDRTHVGWAMDLIRRDIAVMSRRIAGGDVGNGDAPRERKLISVIADFIRGANIPSYNIPEAMKNAGIVPRSVLQNRTQRVHSFSSHHNGATYAMDTALKSLVDNGYIQEVGREKLVESYGYHGRAFRVIHLPI
jgi:hypothetical protein